MTTIDTVVVTGFGAIASNFRVNVQFWQDDSTYLGSDNIMISKSSVHAGTDWRALISAAVNTYCDNSDFTHPSHLWVGFDGETVPVANITGLATVATTGAYADLTGKPTIPNGTRTTSTLSLSLVGTGATGTQISATKDSTVRLNVSTSTTSTIGGPSTSAVALKICSTNNATEASWTTVATLENDQTITLALTLNSIQAVKGQLVSDVPAGWYVKLVNTGSGTHSEAFISGQETIYG